MIDEHKSWRFCVAPMMDWTDRHCRYFHRLLSRHARLYTEMLTSDAVLHGDRERLLGFDPTEQPIALQLGGSDPAALAHCARIGAEFGYAEINLNAGCPSDRVQSGRFGACLMAEPALVADCVAAMRAAVEIPVTVKTRIGIDDQDSYDVLAAFVDHIAAAGCRTIIVHARKAWLQGLSPRQNREIPPLEYPRVYRLKRDFPQLSIIINGGIVDLEAVNGHLERVDGVMLGRAAYQNPYLLAEVDQRLFAGPPPRSRRAVVEALLPYVERQLLRGERLQAMVRHVLGLYQGQPGARHWRRYLSEHAHRRGAGVGVLVEALHRVERIREASPELAATG
jgi:tRNA-dihydrouridine synthase A